jgi:hypothetical protein
MRSDGSIREIFHFLFLERLLKTAPPDAFALKGGVNLRFFFGSPRYSEDMDLDVVKIPVHQLREIGYRLLADKALLRALQAYGIHEIRINDPKKAKQTETTQRFRLRLVSSSGEEFPTKVEFSRRGGKMSEVLTEAVRSEVSSRYQRLSFIAPHYPGGTAALQKMQALANRKVPQVRDLFDLHILSLGGHVQGQDICRKLSASEIVDARETVASFSEADYNGQILDYLEEEERPAYERKGAWGRIQESVLSLLCGDD